MKGKVLPCHLVFNLVNCSDSCIFFFVNKKKGFTRERNHLLVSVVIYFNTILKIKKNVFEIHFQKKKREKICTNKQSLQSSEAQQNACSAFTHLSVKLGHEPRLAYV